MGRSIIDNIEDCLTLDKQADRIAKRHPELARKIKEKSGRKLARAVARLGKRSKNLSKGRQALT